MKILSDKLGCFGMMFWSCLWRGLSLGLLDWSGLVCKYSTVLGALRNGNVLAISWFLLLGV